MTTATGRLLRYSLDNPDETRPFEQNSGKVDVVNTDSGTIGRAVFEPGWQWSKHVKPIANTESCQVAHMGYLLSGAMTIRMDDGSEETFRKGDVMICDPGHDAWVVGDEACEVVDWTGFADYAKAK
ncbi:MAG: cupin domain-containing protein [Candidatus Dormibacteraeota bacterium]|nr:cupin domain-containing protein [Candidatus Dormibacteraeota bacterium]